MTKMYRYPKASEGEPVPMCQHHPRCRRGLQEAASGLVPGRDSNQIPGAYLVEEIRQRDVRFNEQASNCRSVNDIQNRGSLVVRIKRHDAAWAYICRILPCQDSMVKGSLSNCGRKSDVMATMGQLTVVPDVQVGGQQLDSEWAQREKIRKYVGSLDIIYEMTRTTEAANILSFPAIISWRRLWCQKSDEDLLEPRDCQPTRPS